MYSYIFILYIGSGLSQGPAKWKEWVSEWMQISQYISTSENQNSVLNTRVIASKTFGEKVSLHKTGDCGLPWWQDQILSLDPNMLPGLS